MRTVLWLVLSTTIPLLACARDAPEVPYVVEGSSLAEVISALGEPRSALAPPFPDNDAPCKASAARALVFRLRSAEKSRWEVIVFVDNDDRVLCTQYLGSIRS